VNEAYYRVGDIARRLGCSPAAVRLWEREGIVTPRRSPKGHRIYDEEDLERLRRAYYLRSVEKLNVPAIKKLLDGVDSPPRQRSQPRLVPLGARLRTLRKERGLTLEGVAASSGLSTSFLSALERGQSNTTVATLRRLLSLYGTTLDSLMRASGRSRVGRVTHAGKRRRIGERFSGVIVEQLTNGPAEMEAQLFSVEPGGGSQGAYAHEGEEFIYVLEGQLQLRLGASERYRLVPGDCAYYPSTLEHEWWNSGDSAARLLWVNTPPTF
jgi:DNA-binding transcriptional MerR regulator/quercetin dioxygenase-like cupin family protein